MTTDAAAIREQLIEQAAQALDNQQDKWVPEDGIEDLFLLDPRYPVERAPEPLRDISRVVIDALSFPAKLAAAEELAELLTKAVEDHAQGTDAIEWVHKAVEALAKYREATA